MDFNYYILDSKNYTKAYQKQNILPISHLIKILN